MGWWSRPDYKPSDWKAELMEEFKKNSFVSILDHKTTCFGKRWWILFETKDGGRFIALYLFERFRSGWGYKDMDESCGPYFYDCPMSLLKRTTAPTNEWSANWRSEVQRYHIERKTKRNQEKDFISDYPRY